MFMLELYTRWIFALKIREQAQSGDDVQQIQKNEIIAKWPDLLF